MTNDYPPADSHLRGNDESLSLVILAHSALLRADSGEDLLTFLQRMFACANMTNDYPPADSRMRGNDESLSLVILAFFLRHPREGEDLLNIHKQIVPIGINCIDEPFLPFSIPMFQLLFSSNSIIYRLELLKIDQAIHIILGREGTRVEL